MLTFFTTGKPFDGHDGMIQRNALQSWKRLDPEVEVILFGDDAGAREVSSELGLRHEPNVVRHKGGPKYLNSIFKRAVEIARHEYLCFSNCDIIVTWDFREAVRKCFEWKREFLMVGRRWDTDVRAPIRFDNRAWETDIRALALSTGRRQDHNFLDYFVFPGGLYRDMPPLVIGRSYWDHWLIWRALSAGLPVIDCSRSVIAIHQNHDYAYHPRGKVGTHEDFLAQQNFILGGEGRHLRSLPDATYAMTKAGKIVRTPYRRLWHSAGQGLSMLSLQNLINRTDGLRERVGLKRATMARAKRRIAAWFR